MPVQVRFSNCIGDLRGEIGIFRAEIDRDHAGLLDRIDADAVVVGLHHTLLARHRAAVPVSIVSALLLFDAKGLFAILLGRSATMPPGTVPILLVLLATAAIKSAPNFLLQHTGYFRTIARLSIFNIALMTAAVVTGLLLHADVVGFLALYPGTFVVVAALYVTLAVRGPLRDTAKT